MDVKNIAINTIGLSARSLNALHRIEIHTVGEMIELTESYLYGVRNLGKKSIDEILSKISEYKELEKNDGVPEKAKRQFVIPADYDAWILEKENQRMVIEYLKEKKVRIDEVELLSPKAYNLLLFHNFEYLFQIAFLSKEQLMQIPRMDEQTAAEIVQRSLRTIRERQGEILHGIAESQSVESGSKVHSLTEMLCMPEFCDVILQYVKTNDIPIEQLGLSTRPKNLLLNNGNVYLSDIIFSKEEDFINIPTMGTGSVREIMSRIEKYLQDNEERLLAFCTGDTAVLWTDVSIRNMVLSLYEGAPFQGFSLNEIITGIKLPEEVTVERLKSIIGKMLAAKELEYVDYRCYRIYGKFTDYVCSCPTVAERNKDFIMKRLKGITLEEIGREYGLTRERIRQVVKKDIEKVKKYYTEKTGLMWFDEDYFRYFFENYSFEKNDGSEWLGMPKEVWNYFELLDVKNGKKSLEEALDDSTGLNTGMRLKINNYLNRSKIFIDGMWIDKKRSELERVLVRKLCTDSISFDEFSCRFNQFLEKEEIPYSEELYYTDQVYRSRKSRLSEAKFLFWTQNETIRYYDIEGTDFSELLDTLNLEAYENIELSTEKFMEAYPKLMAKYDIRNQYELHNLLRKIVEEGSYHDFHCSRTPHIKFGNPDRTAAVYHILRNNYPVTVDEAANLLHNEFGFDEGTAKMNYLKPFFAYYHNGVFSFDQKKMSEERREILQSRLTEDFYYIEEVQQIYKNLFPDGDPEEINPYNFKVMGFSVYSRYVLQNYPTLEEYFRDLLTREDIVDISAYRRRYVYVQVFSVQLMELKRSLDIIEYEPNQIINFRKLQEFGITKEMIHEFCSAAYDFTDEGECFTNQSLRLSGFHSELYELGFSDWFYANLLISDPRFTFANVFKTKVFYKGIEQISRKSFIADIIKSYGEIDAIDLSRELNERYGCDIHDKSELVYNVQDTEIYYDKLLDRFYASTECYYRDLYETGV